MQGWGSCPASGLPEVLEGGCHTHCQASRGGTWAGPAGRGGIPAGRIMNTTAGVHGKVWGLSGVICFGMTGLHYHSLGDVGVHLRTPWNGRAGGGQPESTSSCCLRCEWQRVRVFALRGAAGQRHSLWQPSGPDSWHSQGAPGSSDSRGAREQCRVDKGYLVTAAGPREGRPQHWAYQSPGPSGPRKGSKHSGVASHCSLSHGEHWGQGRAGVGQAQPRGPLTGSQRPAPGLWQVALTASQRQTLCPQQGPLFSVAKCVGIYSKLSKENLTVACNPPTRGPGNPNLLGLRGQNLHPRGLFILRPCAQNLEGTP